MVANTHTFIYYSIAQPDTTDNGTLVAVPYSDEGFRYKPTGNFVDRGDLKYSAASDDWWEFDFQKGVRLTHKAGFDGIGVDIYLNGEFQSRQYLVTGEIYFEVHPNTTTVKTVRVVIADQATQPFLLQTGLDKWI